MSIYEMVKDSPKFKAFCRPRICAPIIHKAFKPVKISLPKRKGLLSVVGEYQTGRRLVGAHCTYSEILTLRRVYDASEGAFVITSSEPSKDPEVGQGVADYFVHQETCHLCRRKGDLRALECSA